MSNSRFCTARSTLDVSREGGLYGRDAWAKVVAVFLDAWANLLSILFARTWDLRAIGSKEEEIEKARLLEPPSEADEPERKVEDHHQAEPDKRLSLAFGERIPVPFTCVHDAIASQVFKNPSLPAVEHLGESVSYSQLDWLSSILSQRLRGSGVTRETRVLLLAQRSIPFVVGIVGVLKTGASYIPLDGGIVTDETLRSIIEDAAPKAILCSRRFSQRIAGWNVAALILEDILESSEDRSTYDLVSVVTKPEEEAYVIYTSGTTGRPKGVSVSHANVTNLLCTAPGNLGIRPGMRVSQLLNIAFDMCVWEVLGCLTNGGTLVLRDSSPTPNSSPAPSLLPLTKALGLAGPVSKRDATSEWVSLLKTVDVMVATPSILAKFDPMVLSNIRSVAVAGEPCSQALADSWSIGRDFYNCCGPTETTIINTAHLHRLGSQNTIGSPTPNNSVYVLDEQLHPTPIGVPGTLWAGGAGVSRGYVNRTELTVMRYRLDPFVRDGMMYNTGDLGVLLPNGELQHLGRVDDQVKVKGFRVELDGVANCISRCPGVLSSAVLFDKDRTELWGFYEPPTAFEGDVRSTVARIQPYYAVPRYFLGLDSMPLTSNGKVDKTELRRRMEQYILMRS